MLKFIFFQKYLANKSITKPQKIIPKVITPHETFFSISIESLFPTNTQAAQ